MTTIDDLGRRAATEALADARRAVDVDAGLARVLREAPRPAEPIRDAARRAPARRWLALAGAAVVVVVTTAAVVLLRDEPRRLVPVDTVPVDTVPVDTVPVDTVPSTTATATDPPTTTVPTSIAPTSTAPVEAVGGWTVERLGLSATCDPRCTSVALDLDGNVVVYDPSAATLQLLGPTPRTVDVSGLGLVAEASYLELVGPDQVAYVMTQQPGVQDPVGNVLAIATAGPRSGQVAARVDGLDMSGDTDLVATPTGIVEVGCCGGDPVRPDPARTPILEWVDSTGANTLGPQGSDVTVAFADGNAVVTRGAFAAVDARSWTIADVPGYRGMPPLVATDDGGAIISLQDPFDTTSPSRVAVLGADGSVEEHSITPYLPLDLAADGSVLAIDGDEYVLLRQTALPDPEDADGAVTTGFAFEPTYDPGTCTVTSSSLSTVQDAVLRPFVDLGMAPASIQVVGAPAPDGAAGPFAVILRYPSAPRQPGAETVTVAAWAVDLQVFPNGNGEARWNLPDGTQGYLRSRGMADADLVDILGRLTPRSVTASVPGFDYATDGAAADRQLVAESSNTGVSGGLGRAICTVPDTGLIYRTTVLSGSDVFEFVGVIDRDVPLTVGVVEHAVVVIDGAADPAAPTIADVVPAPLS